MALLGVFPAEQPLVLVGQEDTCHVVSLEERFDGAPQHLSVEGLPKDASIVAFAASETCRLLAVAYSSKQVFLYRYREDGPDFFEESCVLKTSKRPTAMAFTPDVSSLIVSDKFGEAYR